MLMLRQISRSTQILSRNARTFMSTVNGRTYSTETLTTPAPEGFDVPANPKLLSIVNDIAKLNLLEVSELSALLKKTLNLPDAPVVAYGGAPAAVAQEDEEESKPKTVQTSFKVKLSSFDESKKIALIKELKNLMEGTNLVQAKKFIESAPAYIKEDVPRDEADKLKEALEKLGAVVEIQ